MKTVAALSLLALAACQPAGPVAAPGGGGLSLVPAPGGLLVQGSGGREIGFGRDRQGALDSVARVEGMVPRGVACGGERVAFTTASDLRLVFEGGAFVGWQTEMRSAGRICA